MSLRIKFIGAFLVIGLLPVFSVSLFSISKGRDALQNARIEELKNVRLEQQ
ncbi:MAG: hypothetical protein QGG67_21390 [Gammaproteobacteria bacterium]|jgi:hypothetical protein|nr:hypothetical protein [Gammaproteobacteria bacterium]|tara:strand:- start:557 stop:709 length:153 start_codon:yes stop_codon:yes gene_type:complete